jgi:hypothetical protein
MGILAAIAKALAPKKTPLPATAVGGRGDRGKRPKLRQRNISGRDAGGISRGVLM